MKKTLYYVSYTSYFSELYNEVKVFDNLKDAVSAYHDYLHDIGENFNDDDRAEELFENFKDCSRCEQSLFGGESFLLYIDTQDITSY